MTRKIPRWQDEWLKTVPAKRLPRAGTKSAKLFESIDKTPTTYQELWIRAGFETDPFLRTQLRKWAKADYVNRAVTDGTTEEWSLP